MAQADLDPQFLKGLRLLYSSSKDSAEQLKGLLDDVIRQKYGSSKMLCNTLHKKYTMEEIVLSDNGSSSSKKSKSSSSSKHSKTSRANSPLTINDNDIDDDNLAMAILDDDLTCVVCRGMDIGARNRLVECKDCGSLYHQECHVPNVPDSQIDETPVIWYCHTCIKNNQAKQEALAPKTETKSKDSKKSHSMSHKDKYKSSSSSSHSHSQNAGNNSKVPSINIISAADRRIKDIIKKSNKDGKRSSSSSSSSKHSSSSSSKSHEKSQK